MAETDSSNPLRVLLIEDSADDAALVLRELRKSGRRIECQRVEEAGPMRAALEEQRWDFIISDWSMPRFSAARARAVLKESGLDLPFIIVSGTIGEESAVEAMRTGANDYLLKTKLGRLVPAVERELRELQSRQELRQSELRRSAIVEFALDAIVGMNGSGAITEFNPAAERIFGYSRAEASGQKLAELIIPPRFRETPDPGLLGLERYLTEGTAERESMLGKRREISALRRDGVEIPVELAVIQIGQIGPNGRDGKNGRDGQNGQNESGAPPSYIAFIRDLSDRKRAEEALRTSEIRFSTLAESGIIGITITDPDGNVIEANDAYLSMVGYTREDLTSGLVKWSEMTPPEWQHLSASVVEQLAQTGYARPFEKEYFRKDGSRVPVLTGIAKIDGTYTIAFSTDLTDKKRAENALHRSEEQLRQSQKMDAIGRLAGGVAHDFNNMLSVILGFAGMILEDLPESDPLRDDINEIKKAGERAGALTRQLLAFSRQQVVEPRILDLNEIITHTDKMLRRLIGEDVQLITIPGAALGRVKGDPGYIEQVIVNLVVNARDAMPDGGKLTIETENVILDEDYAADHHGTRPGPHVMLAVTDTGTGMDKETLAHIFEPFFTTKPKGKGTGLGLSTVFGIVEQCGGSVWVYSELGRGTTFKVYLPRTDQVDAGGDPNAGAGNMRGSETILLVEDEEQVRRVARSILRRCGYQLLEAHTPADAIEICQRHEGTIELLLTDLVMPQMNGRQLADRLHGLRPQMKILFMSGYTENTISDDLESGSAFLQKPLTPDALTRKVRILLDEEIK